MLASSAQIPPNAGLASVNSPTSSHVALERTMLGAPDSPPSGSLNDRGQSPTVHL